MTFTLLHYDIFMTHRTVEEKNIKRLQNLKANFYKLDRDMEFINFLQLSIF